MGSQSDRALACFAAVGVVHFMAGCTEAALRGGPSGSNAGEWCKQQNRDSRWDAWVESCECTLGGAFPYCWSQDDICIEQDENSEFDEAIGECVCPFGTNDDSGMCHKAPQERCLDLNLTTWNAETETCVCTHDPKSAKSRCPTEQEVCARDAWATWDDASKCICRLEGTPGKCVTGQAYCVASDAHSAWDATEEKCVCPHGADADQQCKADPVEKCKTNGAKYNPEHERADSDGCVTPLQASRASEDDDDFPVWAIVLAASFGALMFIMLVWFLFGTIFRCCKK